MSVAQRNNHELDLKPHLEMTHGCPYLMGQSKSHHHTPEFSRMGMYHVLGKMLEITWPSFLPRGQGCLIFLQGEAPQVTWGKPNINAVGEYFKQYSGKYFKQIL